MAFVGRSLMPARNDGQKDAERDDRVPLDVIARFKALWESRVASATFSDEAPAFGWWFASGRFDDAWSLAELLRAARTARSIDGLMFGADRFRRLSESMPVEAAQFVYALVCGHERQSWIFELDKVLRPALETILRSGGPAAALGEQIVNALGERQIADYTDLLRNRR